MFNCKVSSISTLIQNKDHMKTCMHNSMQITPAKVSTLHHYFCCVKLFQPSILKETCKSNADNLHLQVRLLEKWLCFVFRC